MGDTHHRAGVIQQCDGLLYIVCLGHHAEACRSKEQLRMRTAPHRICEWPRYSEAMKRKDDHAGIVKLMPDDRIDDLSDNVGSSRLYGLKDQIIDNAEADKAVAAHEGPRNASSREAQVVGETAPPLGISDLIVFRGDMLDRSIRGGCGGLLREPVGLGAG